MKKKIDKFNEKRNERDRKRARVRKEPIETKKKTTATSQKKFIFFCLPHFRSIVKVNSC